MSEYGLWDPLSPAKVSVLMLGFDPTWWVAGGWAIDLFLGRQTRDHHDTDIGTLRRDQRALQRHFASWDLHCADPPGLLRPWLPDETLAVGVHDIWCRQAPGEPWRLQIMLNESDGDEIVSRRDSRVRLKLSDAIMRPAAGVPFLAPEVQLYFKAKAVRERDELDFAAVLPALDDARRVWLANAISRSYGPEHPWLECVT